MTKSLGGWKQAWLVRTDSTGVKQWEKAFGAWEGDEQANCVQPTAEGGFIMAGSRTDVPDGPIVDAYLVYFRP